MGDSAVELDLQPFLADLELLGYRREERASLIVPLLQRVQDQLGHVPNHAIPAIARATGVPESRVFAVASYYPTFALSPEHETTSRAETELQGLSYPPGPWPPSRQSSGIRRTRALRRLGPPAPNPGGVGDAVSPARSRIDETSAVPARDHAPVVAGRDSPEIGRWGADRVLARCGVIDPLSIEDFLSHGGYEGLSQARQMAPEALVETVTRSGLRGCGGAGFPTGRKWQTARQADSDERFVVCNAAEGDVGAFADRALLAGDPHAILEGMAIAARVIGAQRGFVYLRAEYVDLTLTIARAIREAKARGFLGDGFTVELFQAAGRYVCGEETALLNSMEGKPGRPRSRPPFPAQAGLWGKPTVVHNVKTLAQIPLILRYGAEWFSSIGTERSKGTALLSLSGQIANPGIVEVPMGTPLREVIYEIGGGPGCAAGGKRLKAVQTGGPLGGLIPESGLDVPICYDAMAKAGSPLGSGGLIAISEDQCIVAIARLFAGFAAEESCGYCAPCRLGTKRALDVLAAITRGIGRREDVDYLASLGEALGLGSFCAFGQGSLNVTLSAIAHFRDEFDRHVADHQCPAGICAMEAS